VTIMAVYAASRRFGWVPEGSFFRDPTGSAGLGVYAYRTQGWNMTVVMARAQTEEESFRAFVTPHLAALRRFAAVLVRSPDVDDLLQDTLARAWIKHAQFDAARGAAVSWLMAIMADRARKRWRAATPSLQLVDHDRAVDEPDSAVLDLRRAVDSLPPRQRTAIVLYHYLDLSVADVAQYMGCSTGTVKSNLSEARASLGRRLGAPYVRLD
jgi:RNA polymerase sigma-70 factor (ECF subfamily)